MAILPAPHLPSLTGQGHDRRLLGPDGRPIDRDDDGFLVHHHRLFSSLLNVVQRQYSWRFDEAVRHAHENALAMRRDPFIMGVMQERYLQLTGLDYHLEAEDQKDPVQREVVGRLKKIVDATSRFRSLLWSLSEAIWYGRYGVELNWKPVRVNGRTHLVAADHVPVNGDKIQYGFDGVPRLMINHKELARLKEKNLARDEDLEAAGQRGPTLALRDPRWRQRFVIHKHNRSDADYFDGEMAGGVHGVGIRSQIYWLWHIRDEMLGWAINHLKKIGVGGILIFYYDEGNDAARVAAENSAKSAGERYALAMPRPRGASKDAQGVDHLSFDNGGVAALTSIISDYFERHIERLIIGQELSSKAGGTGLGSGVANLQADCVPVEGSEILTRDGFKSPEEVQVGEDVLAYDPETDTCRWTPMQAKTFYDDIPVVRAHVDGQRPFEAVCTPNHSWAVQQPRRANGWRRNPPAGEMEVGTRGGKVYKDSPRFLAEAQKIAGKGNRRLILAAPEVESTESVLTPAEAAILGWAVCDGHIRWISKHARVAICQSKEEHFGHIRELARAAGMREWHGGPFTRTFPNGRTYDCKPQHWWVMPGADGLALLKKCGYTGKHDLPRIVTRLSPEAREAMLEAFMRAEADEDGNFANKNRHLIEAFDILCALQGRATGKLQRREMETPSAEKDCWIKRMKATRYVGTYRMKLDDAGRARVWCPTTKYGTWVMRQNGRVTITGNTKYRILQFDARNLEDTLTEEFVKVALRWNFPQADFRVRFVFDLPDPRADAKLQAASVVLGGGAKIKTDELLAAAGFSKPEDDDETVDQVTLQTNLLRAQTDVQIEGMLKQAQLQQQTGLPAQDPNAQPGQPGMGQPGAEMPGMEMPQPGAGQMPGTEATEGQLEMPDLGTGQPPAAPAPAAEVAAATPGGAPAGASAPPPRGRHQGPPEEAAEGQAEEEGAPPPEVADVLAELLGQEPPPEGAADLSAEEEGRLWADVARLAAGTPDEPPAAPPQQMLGLEDQVTYEAQHAPKGGVTLGGTFFPGGSFIPKGALAKASPQEKAALAQARSQDARPAPQQPQAQQPQAQQPQQAPRADAPADAPADALSEGLSGRPAEDPDRPVVTPQEWGELVEVGLRGYRNFAALPPEAQRPVFESARQFASMPLKEFRREAGRAFERWRAEETRTQQDIYDAAAAKMILAYRGKKSREDYARQAAKRGVPAAVHQAAKYASTRGLKYLMSKKHARASVNNHLIGSWMRDASAGHVGLDPESRQAFVEQHAAPARESAMREAAARGLAEEEAAAHAERAAGEAESYAQKKLALKSHLHDVGVNVAKDLVQRALEVGIMTVPTLLQAFLHRKQPQYHIHLPEGAHPHQGDDAPLIYLRGEEPAAYVAPDGALVPYDYGPLPEAQGGDPEGVRAARVLAAWLKDVLLATARGTGWPVPRADWESWAAAEAEALAPLMLKVLGSAAG